MQIYYPYNEILPKRAAHDAFLFDECAALAQVGLDVTLLCGRGSDRNLFTHYGVPQNTFNIKRLPILRKNNPFNLTCNRLFFACTQRQIARARPDWVILSVRKQSAYHLKRKIPGVRYLYEVHELAHYPTHTGDEFALEREMLAAADLITVTTESLKEILQRAPYSLTTPIEVVPLAVKKEPLAPPKSHSQLHLMYIGQLYKGQGVEQLLTAMERVTDVHLTIVGGKREEIARFRAPKSVTFTGFVAPAELSARAVEADVFVAPFESTGRMPYVAHTKLLEYAHWGRPIIAPDLPVVREHFASGALLFTPGSAVSLADCIERLKSRTLRAQLQEEIAAYAGRFSWPARALRYRELIGKFK